MVFPLVAMPVHLNLHNSHQDDKIYIQAMIHVLYTEVQTSLPLLARLLQGPPRPVHPIPRPLPRLHVLNPYIHLPTPAHNHP
jgi:hypothetical protein